MPQITQSQSRSGWKDLRGHLVKPLTAVCSLCSTHSPAERQRGEKVAKTAVEPLTPLLYLSQTDGNHQPITTSPLQKEHPRQRPTHHLVATDHTHLLNSNVAGLGEGRLLNPQPLDG